MKWSILICTISNRLGYLHNLVTQLNDLTDSYKDIEVIYLGDNKKRATGQKRQLLIDMAQGEYISFVDDDDELSNFYVEEIYPQLNGVDCVNFKVQYSNGPISKEVIYNKDYIRDSNTSSHYLRLPNHLMAVKRELALKAGFENKYIYEDREYAKRLKPLLRNQKILDKILYFYNFDANISETTKHLKK